MRQQTDGMDPPDGDAEQEEDADSEIRKWRGVQDI